jgi:peptidoglycan glycosyltransferase
MIPKSLPLFLAALLMLAGCDQVTDAVDPAPRAEEAAAAFLTALSEQEAATLADQLTNSEEWDERRLEFFLGRTLESGATTSLTASLEGTVQQPPDEAFTEGGPPIKTTAPYLLNYESDASVRPVEFSGELEMDYAAEEDRWTVTFEKALLWPEHEDASGFGVEEIWPKRAAILDRNGKKLAVGSDEERNYPQGSVAGTTVGHLEPGEGGIDRLQGGSGLELALDEELAGTPTQRFVVVGPDPKGCPDASTRRSGGSTSKTARKKARAGSACGPVTIDVLGRVAGERGRDIKTTLDMDVQRAAENAYGGTTGGSVVMDPATGDLLAVVSSSPFDPGNYVGVGGIEPFNRALSGLYPPGSSLKVMTGAAALQEGVVKESTMLTGPAEYKGVRNFESGEFGSLDFATAVKFSVNTAFAQIAEDLGPKRLTRYAELFGFNAEPSMPLGAGTSSFPFPEDEGDVMWGSIGQAQVLASPLQMATIAATIANGGKRMEPRILLKDPKQGERVVTSKVARTMTGLMENVVTGGTGTGANIAGAQVAGKTGTAEVDVDGKRRNHAWFISFAPSDGAEVAVSVVSELGGVGGEVAAPLAGRILAAVLPLVK